MIRVQKTEGILEITLDRPDKANALTAEMLEEIASVASEARRERCVILTGAGRVFSAGADLEAARAGLAKSDVWERVSCALAEIEGLTICALNGALAGGAFGMALACDLRIAVPHSKFFYPVMKLGFLPQPSDPARLRALVGPSRAKLILMAGQKLTVEEAYDFGLVDRIVEGDVLDAARDLATDTCAAPNEIAFGIKAMCAE